MNIISACVRNCCLDQRDVCMGCGRTLDEIIRWGGAEDAERAAILARAKKRVKSMAGRRPYNDGADSPEPDY